VILSVNDMSLITIKITKSGVAGIGRRELQAVGRESIRAAANLWVDKYLPLHFKRSAILRYSYKPRKHAYRTRKIKKSFTYGPDKRRAIGEDVPLVFTGRTRESATQNNRIEAKASNYKSYYANITMPAPALNFLPHLRDELTRIHPQEARAMERLFGKEYEKQLNKRGRTNKKTKTYKAAA